MYSVLANPHPPRSSPRVVDKESLNRRLEYSLSNYLNRIASRPPSMESSDDGSRPSLPESRGSFFPGRYPRKRRPPSSPPPPTSPSLLNPKSGIPPYGFASKGEKKNDMKHFDLWSNRAEDEKILKLWKFQELTQAHLEMIRSISDNIDLYTSQMPQRSTERTSNDGEAKGRKFPKNEAQSRVKFVSSQQRGNPSLRKRISDEPMDPTYLNRREEEEPPEPILRVENRDAEGRDTNMKTTRSLPMPFGKTLPHHRVPADIEIAIAKKEIQRLITVAKKKLEKKRREREQRMNASMVTEDEGDSDGKTTSPEMEDSIFDRPRGKMSCVLPALAKILRNSRRMAFVPVKKQSKTPVFRDTVVAIEMPEFGMSQLEVRPIKSTVPPSPTPVAVETEDEQASLELVSLRGSASGVSNATHTVVPVDGLHENSHADVTGQSLSEDKSSPKESSVTVEEQQDQSETKTTDITAVQSSGPTMISRKNGSSSVRLGTPRMESSSMPNTKICEQRKAKVVARRSSQKGVRRPQTATLQRRSVHTPPTFAQRSRPQTASFPMDRSQRGARRTGASPRPQTGWASPRRPRSRTTRTKARVLAPNSRATLDTDMSRSKLTLHADSTRSKMTLAAERRSRGTVGGKPSIGASLCGDKSRTHHLGGDKSRTGPYHSGDKSRMGSNITDKRRNRANLSGERARNSSVMRGEGVRSRMSGVSMGRQGSQPFSQTRPATPPTSHMSGSKSRRLHAPSTLTTTSSGIRPRTSASTRSRLQRYSGNSSKGRPLQSRTSSVGGSRTRAKRSKGRVKS